MLTPLDNSSYLPSIELSVDLCWLIVSCSDSRVTPTTVFNAGLGEIFDVRLAGNVVDDDALGSIEYAVQHLNTPLVIVMGHQSCGAVTATYNEVVKGEKVTGNMKSFV